MPDSMSGSAVVAGLGAAGLMLCISSKLQDRRVDSSRQHRLDPALQDRGKALPLLLQKRALKDNTKYGEEQYVYRVCLTGGPCGGKSSSQEALSKALTAEGYNVFFAPEVPTILMNGGCQYPGLAPENKAQLTAFEDGIIQMQLQMERSFTRIAASTGKPSVVIFDRGLLDIPAYLPREAWLELLETLGFTEEYFAGRYDIVLHLVTTAHGVEDVYEVQKSNNPARQETAQQARELCDKVFDCWRLHPNVLKLENTSEGFAAKLVAGTQAVIEMITAKKVWLGKKAADNARVQ
eukprot:COSAG06_NODE_35_length_30757_cov_53.112532_9_plen_293_part_00